MKELNEKELDQINGGATTPDGTDSVNLDGFFSKFYEKLKKFSKTTKPIYNPIAPIIFPKDK